MATIVRAIISQIFGVSVLSMDLDDILHDIGASKYCNPWHFGARFPPSTLLAVPLNPKP